MSTMWSTTLRISSTLEMQTSTRRISNPCPKEEYGTARSKLVSYIEEYLWHRQFYGNDVFITFGIKLAKLEKLFTVNKKCIPLFQVKQVPSCLPQAGKQ
uniref:Uncharacterized protein n=1 Tax=Ditylenchus dipsaci TaxID=166011 RepID=A0A915D9H8_9BILA